MPLNTFWSHIEMCKRNHLQRQFTENKLSNGASIQRNRGLAGLESNWNGCIRLVVIAKTYYIMTELKLSVNKKTAKPSWLKIGPSLLMLTMSQHLRLLALKRNNMYDSSLCDYSLMLVSTITTVQYSRIQDTRYA